MASQRAFQFALPITSAPYRAPAAMVSSLISSKRGRKSCIKFGGQINSREILHAAQVLKLWGVPVVVRGSNSEQAAFRAVPIAVPRAVDNWEYNPEVDGDDDAGSVNTGSHDGRCSNFWR